MLSTIETYAAFRRAYLFYNERLFGGKLGDVLFTLARKKGSNGYFWFKKFEPYKTEGPPVNEIAVNPDFQGRTVEEVLSTLVHEMVHYLHYDLYGYEESKKNGGHPASWRALMEQRGLIPYSTSSQGTGKGTGKHVSHTIEPGGAFEQATRDLLATGFRLPLASRPQDKKSIDDRKSTTTYSCDPCDQKVRGDVGQSIVCGICKRPML
jgi:predicted SprT family Zn-dependent metalloprotease